MPADTLPARPAITGRFSRLLTLVLVALVGAVLVNALFEGWIQALLGSTSRGYLGRVILHEVAWPKAIKNGLFLALVAGTLLKVVVDRRWRDFTTGADIAVVVLGVVLITAGLVNGSSLSLIVEAGYVYLRGAIVFYALRAAAPAWSTIRPVILVMGGLVALNTLVALAQMIGGPAVYQAFGWVDMTWANTARSQGMLNHPNHLGHVLALSIIGLLLWARSRDRMGRRVWIAVGALALALSASQSRESIIALCVTMGLLWLVRGIAFTRMAIVGVLIVAFTGAQIVLRPDNQAEWQKRLNGVAAALRFPTGDEGHRTESPAPSVAPSAVPSVPPSPARSVAPSRKPSVKPSAVVSSKPAAVASPAPSPAPSTTYVPPREIRVLYFLQSLRLIEAQPVLGYGVGQFGGIVAEKNNPNWHLNPAFGPEGFDRHGFAAKQVDSFWLHLIVEAGVLGVLAYLAWMALVGRPLLRRTERFRGDRRPGGPYVYWGLAALVFGFQVAFLSASLEDPLLPALMFAIVALGWLFPDRGAPSAPSAAS